MCVVRIIFSPISDREEETVSVLTLNLILKHNFKTKFCVSSSLVLCGGFCVLSAGRRLLIEKEEK